MRILFPLLISLMSFVANAANVTFGGIVLLQPDFVLQQRGVDVKEFANLIRTIQAQTEKDWKEEKLQSSSGFLVVAVREGKKVNAWFDMEPAVPIALENRTKKLIQENSGFYVSSGTIMVALKISINGAMDTSRQTPMPKEWKAAMKTQTLPVETENLVKLVWP